MLDPIETESSLKLACDDGVARLCHNFEAVSARTCSVLGVRRLVGTSGQLLGR